MNTPGPEPDPVTGKQAIPVNLGQAPITLDSNQVRLWTAAAGGADRRSAKNAATPMNQSREAHHPAQPLYSPYGA
jgi:hypothetical protein